MGGCCHDYANQKEILTRGLSRRAKIEWTIAHDPDTGTRHKNPVYDRPDWSRDFDVVVHDECTSDVNDMRVIETILKPHKDGLPAVVLHCGMHSYRTEGWDRNVATPWMQFTGLISTGHGPQEPIAVKFVDTSHAITRDLGDWTTVDEELYNNASGKLEPTAHALASGTQVYTVLPGREGSHRQGHRRLDQHLQRQDQGLRHDPRPQQRDGQRSPLPRPGRPRPALVPRQARRRASQGRRVGQTIGRPHRTPHSHRPNDVFASRGRPDCLSVQPICPRWWDSCETR